MNDKDKQNENKIVLAPYFQNKKNAGMLFFLKNNFSSFLFCLIWRDLATFSHSQ